jgi:peptide/nickel transport system permease protein
MLGVSFLTFITLNSIAGSAAETVCGLNCTPEAAAEISREFGLDRPWYEQYGDWLGGVVTGDLGDSVLKNTSVASELKERIPITLELLVMTMVLSLVLGIPPGIISAVRPGTPLDFIARLASVFWLSIPNFWLGIVIIVFGVSWFGWTPPQFASGTAVSFFEDPWVNLQQFFFPSLVMALGIGAVIMRLTRSSMLEVLRNDYIRTAWSKGLMERTVVWRHAVKNALIPVVTIIGLQVGTLIGGAVIVESLFNLNGIGKYLLVSILTRDLVVVQSLVLIFAVTYVLVNLAVDVGYGWLDPRIRFG